MKVTTLLKWYIVTMVVALIVLLAACRQLTSGQVIDKHYAEGYYYTTIQSSGKYHYPVTHYHYPEYRLRIKGYNKKGEQITEWWYVSSGNFQRIGIGDIIIKDTTTNW